MQSYRRHTEQDVILVEFITLGLYEGPELEELEERLAEEIARSPTKRMVLDCGRLQFVASRFLHLVVTLSRLAEQHKGALAAYGLRPQLLQLFRISGTDRLITIRDSRQDAIAAIAHPSNQSASTQ